MRSKSISSVTSLGNFTRLIAIFRISACNWQIMTISEIVLLIGYLSKAA